MDRPGPKVVTHKSCGRASARSARDPGQPFRSGTVSIASVFSRALSLSLVCVRSRYHHHIPSSSASLFLAPLPPPLVGDVVGDRPADELRDLVHRCLSVDDAITSFDIPIGRSPGRAMDVANADDGAKGLPTYAIGFGQSSSFLPCRVGRAPVGCLRLEPGPVWHQTGETD